MSAAASAYAARTRTLLPVSGSEVHACALQLCLTGGSSHGPDRSSLDGQSQRDSSAPPFI